MNWNWFRRTAPPPDRRNYRPDAAEIGARFERYVGRLYEARGWRVWYRGIERGKGDRGIDLVATKETRMVLVQCKYWRVSEVIPGVEITRFAEAVEQFIARREGGGMDELPGILSPRTYGKAFVTTAECSDGARKLACEREVQLRERLGYVDPGEPTVEFARTIGGESCRRHRIRYRNRIPEEAIIPVPDNYQADTN